MPAIPKMSLSCHSCLPVVAEGSVAVIESTCLFRMSSSEYVIVAMSSAVLNDCCAIASDRESLWLKPIIFFCSAIVVVYTFLF